MDSTDFSTCNHDSPYQHIRLKDSRSIRILKLHPDCGDGLLQINLVSVSLDEHPQYDALSYAWGDTACTIVVKCGANALRVPKSAYEALLHLRKKSGNRLLWIDALCIDQNNLQERSQQVKMMGEIYSSAGQVLVWLGVADEDSDAVFAHFDRRADVHNIALEATAMEPAFRRFMSRPYFRRIWPIQEVAFASVCIVLCGSHTHTFSDFTHHVIAMQQALTLTFSPPQQLRLHRRLASRRHNSWQGRRSMREVSRILLDARYHEATEPRDKIFALYALLGAMGLELSTPDYTKPVADIFRETTIRVIQHDQSLSILYGLTGTADLLDCPSWVPDWSKVNTISEFIIWEDAQASGLQKYARYSLSQDCKALTLYGCEVDRVETIFAVFPEFESQHTATRDSREVAVLSEWLRTLDSANMDTGTFMQGVCAYSKSFTASWYGPFERTNCLEETVGTWIQGVLACCRNGEMVDSHFKKFLLEHPESTVRNLHTVLRRRLDRKVLFYTQQGLFGIVSQHIELGDCIALFSGCRLPMVMRPEGSNWRLLAPAYVYGVMKGELWKDDMELQSFTFV